MSKDAWDSLGNKPTPPAGNGMVWKKRWEMCDEFERGNHTTWLRKHRWNLTAPHWKGRAPSFFLKSNVIVTNGSLRLHAREQNPPRSYPSQYKTFSTGFVSTKKKQLYGYFEILCKPMENQLASGFWLSQRDNTKWTAIDVFRYSTNNPSYQQRDKQDPFHTIYTNSMVLKHPKLKQPLFKVQHHQKPSHDDNEQPTPVPGHLMTIGLDWTKEKLTWYCNGKVIRRQDNLYFHQPMQLVLDVESFPNVFGLPPINQCHNSSLPNKFEIFWVRSWYRAKQN